MIDLLTFDQLRVLTAVAETGSFSAAGRKLSRAQSAVSYAIANLEGVLGIELFDRSGWRPRLTDAGRALVADAVVVLEATDALKARAKGLGEGLEAEISMVFDIMFPTRDLVSLVAEFQRTFPSVSLSLRVEALGGVPDLVLSGACGLGVQGSLPDIPAGLEFIPLPKSVTVEPVAAPDYPLARHSAPIPKDLLDAHPQIVLTDRSQRTEGRNFAVLSQRQVRTADLGAKQALLRGGLGWGFMPRETVEDDIASGRLAVLNLAHRPADTHSMALSLIYRRDTPPGPAGRWITDHLIQGMGPASQR